MLAETPRNTSGLLASGMTTIADLLFVALFAMAGPLIDHAVFWPAHRRLHPSDPAWARKWLWAWTMCSQWMFVAFGSALWMSSGRSLSALGLALPTGWRLWAAVASILLVGAYQAWAIRMVNGRPHEATGLRKKLEPLAAILPHSRAELRWFGGVSLTAGCAEELLYRGYFIWAFTPWLGWWGAAALSLPFFAAAHFYQGWSGVLRTGAVGALFTLIVAVFESLWPAIILHALIDFGSGTLACQVLCEKPAQAGEGPRPTQGEHRPGDGSPAESSPGSRSWRVPESTPQRRVS